MTHSAATNGAAAPDRTQVQHPCNNVYRNKTATDEFVAENLAGIRYLGSVCEEVGIDVM